MDQERVAQENVAGLAGGPDGGAVGAGPHGLLGGGGPVQAAIWITLTGRAQDGRDVEVRAGPDPGRGIIQADVGEQVEREQAPATGADVDPRPWSSA